MSGHGWRAAKLTEEDRAAIRAERAAGAGQRHIAFKWRIGTRSVCAICGEIEPAAPRRGRSTRLSAEAVAAIRAARERGMAIRGICERWHVSSARAQEIVGGVAFQRRQPGPTSTPLDEAAFRAAGVPDTTANRAACRGHSRAWMRLYRNRLAHPDYLDVGDAVDAIPLRRRG